MNKTMKKWKQNQKTWEKNTIKKNMKKMKQNEKSEKKWLFEIFYLGQKMVSIQF